MANATQERRQGKVEQSNNVIQATTPEALIDALSKNKQFGGRLAGIGFTIDGNQEQFTVIVSDDPTEKTDQQIDMQILIKDGIVPILSAQAARLETRKPLHIVMVEMQTVDVPLMRVNAYNPLRFIEELTIQNLRKRGGNAIAMLTAALPNHLTEAWIGILDPKADDGKRIKRLFRMQPNKQSRKATIARLVEKAGVFEGMVQIKGRAVSFIDEEVVLTQTIGNEIVQNSGVITGLREDAGREIYYLENQAVYASKVEFDPITGQLTMVVTTWNRDENRYEQEVLNLTYVPTGRNAIPMGTVQATTTAVIGRQLGNDNTGVMFSLDKTSAMKPIVNFRSLNGNSAAKS